MPSFAMIGGVAQATVATLRAIEKERTNKDFIEVIENGIADMVEQLDGDSNNPQQQANLQELQDLQRKLGKIRSKSGWQNKLSNFMSAAKRKDDLLVSSQHLATLERKQMSQRLRLIDSRMAHIQDALLCFMQTNTTNNQEQRQVATQVTTILRQLSTTIHSEVDAHMEPSTNYELAPDLPPHDAQHLLATTTIHTAELHPFPPIASPSARPSTPAAARPPFPPSIAPAERDMPLLPLSTPSQAAADSKPAQPPAAPPPTSTARSPTDTPPPPGAQPLPDIFADTIMTTAFSLSDSDSDSDPDSRSSSEGEDCLTDWSDSPSLRRPPSSDTRGPFSTARPRPNPAPPSSSAPTATATHAAAQAKPHHQPPAHTSAEPAHYPQHTRPSPPAAAAHHAGSAHHTSNGSTADHPHEPRCDLTPATPTHDPQQHHCNYQTSSATHDSQQRHRNHSSTSSSSPTTTTTRTRHSTRAPLPGAVQQPHPTPRATSSPASFTSTRQRPPPSALPAASSSFTSVSTHWRTPNPLPRRPAPAPTPVPSANPLPRPINPQDPLARNGYPLPTSHATATRDVPLRPPGAPQLTDNDPFKPSSVPSSPVDRLHTTDASTCSSGVPPRALEPPGKLPHSMSDTQAGRMEAGSRRELEVMRAVLDAVTHPGDYFEAAFGEQVKFVTYADVRRHLLVAYGCDIGADGDEGYCRLFPSFYNAATRTIGRAGFPALKNGLLQLLEAFNDALARSPAGQPHTWGSGNPPPATLRREAALALVERTLIRFTHLQQMLLRYQGREGMQQLQDVVQATAEGLALTCRDMVAFPGFVRLMLAAAARL